MRGWLYLAGFTFYWIHTPIYPDLGVLVGISIGLGELFFTGEGIVLCCSVRNSRMGF